MTMMIKVVVVLVLALGAYGYDYKQLNGPPSEFESHRIPNSANGANFQTTANSLFTFGRQSGNLLTYTQDVVVDSSTGFTVSLLTPNIENTVATMIDPSGNAVDMKAHQQTTYWPVGDGVAEDLGYIYSFKNPAVGIYKITISLTATEEEFEEMLSKSTAPASTNGILLIWNESTDDVYSQLQSYSALTKGDDVGVSSGMYSTKSNLDLLKNVGHVPTFLKDVVSTALLTVRFPNGTFVDFPMHDDGLHGDNLANDGMFGGLFNADVEGVYFMQATLSGTNEDGVSFLRSTEQAVQIVPKSITLTGQVDVDFDMRNQRVVFEIEVEESSLLFDSDAASYQAYLEVSGTQLFTNTIVPIAWTSALVIPRTSSFGRNGAVVHLETDLKWLVEAKALPPFQLNNIVLKEVNSFDPVSMTSAAHTVSMTPEVFAAINASTTVLGATHKIGEHDEQMRFGVRPMHLRKDGKNNLTSPDAQHNLVLLHGYCTKKNPWIASSSVFENGIYFKDFEQSRSHDTFAKLVLDFAASEGSDSYALIGHSQGGIVSTHILNYYWSGVDANGSGRRVQALGSPFQGNSGAGMWAEVLKLLGGCGDNEDLTRDGSLLWLSGLSSEVASQVYFYTTQYDKGGLFGKGYCNTLTNAVLKSPNDGVTENEYAPLPGGNHVNNYVGECHIEDMNWPASYLNESRNKEMNAAAARP
eukprot:m.106485 g.106485  ORF g.106485 m.106485 type:complete len:697 (-) comp9154_c0_seq1:1431-3521(-)